MAKLTKNYKNCLSKLDRTTIYKISEAVKLVKETSKTKFDSTIDIAFNLNLDPRHADQQIRGAIVLPAGTGKTQRVLVLTKTKENDAKEAGADFVGAEDLIQKIQKENWFDFDVIVATPEVMAELGKIGKILGPKGLMPNPKTGTVVTDVKKALEDIKKGKVEYRTDKEGNVHSILGKSSFSDKDLIDNYNSLLNVIKKSKPSSVKGIYIKNISISATMGPGIKVQIES